MTGEMTKAEENIRRILNQKAGYEPTEGFTVKSMVSVLARMGHEVPEDEGGTPIFVVSTEYGEFGAYAILHKDVQKTIQKVLGHKKFYVIPSSIHEILCTPMDNVDPGDLLRIVKMVNATEVEEAEQLMDALFYYDGEHLQYAAVEV